MSAAVLTFGEAVTLAHATGCKVAREGWNGKEQYVFRSPGGQATMSTSKVIEHVNLEPFMVLRNAQGEYVPWAPSQGDMQAVDWMELPA